jgi:hypothetical protein
MSGTQYLSPLLQDPAWQALSRQLSVEARIAIFYLDELWKDERFQRDWTRLKEAYLESQCEAGTELKRLRKQKQYPSYWQIRDLAKESAEQVSCRFFGEWKEKLPYLLRAAFVEYLVARLANEDLDAVEYLSLCSLQLQGIFGEAQFRLAARQLAERLFAGELGELRLLIYREDRLFRLVTSESRLDEPQIFVLRPPLPEESKREYLKCVKNDLEYELELLAEPCSHRQPEILPRFLNELKQLGYEFHNPRNAIPAILALAEDYYEKCAAEQCLQVSNLNDETLARYAQQAYLRVVKGIKLWKQIAEAVMPEGEDLEIWTERVRKTTPTACRLLGICCG